MDNVNDAIVSEIAYLRWGLSPKRRGREWHSPCPQCGGEDRFIIFANGGFWCRHGDCGYRGWLDDDKQDWKPDPRLAQKWLEDKAIREAEQYAKDLAWREGFKVGYIRGWHDAMSERERAWWYQQGITSYQIDHYTLGYIPQKRIRVGDGFTEVAVYTIPIRDPDDWDTIVNIQYRIADPLPGIGKYRQEAGISAAAFFAEPRGINDSAIIVEGAKKAMVVYDRLDGAVQVVGLPGNTPGDRIITKIAEQKYKRIWIALDPGCLAKAENIARQIGGGWVVNLPDKPDDAILRGILTVERLREYARQARQARRI